MDYGFVKYTALYLEKYLYVKDRWQMNVGFPIWLDKCLFMPTIVANLNIFNNLILIDAHSLYRFARVFVMN